MKAIGVGCFWFALRGGEPPDLTAFSPKDHLQKISAALEGLDNISNLKIYRAREHHGFFGLSSSDDDENENFFPIFGDVRISFKLFMPKKVIERHNLGFVRGDSVENFHVEIIYESGMPVTFVHYDVPGTRADVWRYDPSASVVFVREFLTEKLKDHPVIDFQCLGPSPFHADFFVDTNQNKGDYQFTEADLSVPSGGYRTYFFEFRASSIDEATLKFIARFEPLFSAYYQMVRLRNRSLHLTNSITGLTRELIKSRPRSWAVRRRILQGSKIDAVFRHILEEKMNRARIAEYLVETKSDDAIKSDNILYRFLENEAHDVSPAPTDDVKEILKILEDRRQGYIRNSTTILAGLIGGVLGATLTFLLSAHPKSELSGVSTSQQIGTTAPVSHSK